MFSWLQIAGILCHLAGLISTVTCLVLPSWLTKTGSGSSVTIGLWEVCAAGECETIFADNGIVLETMGNDWFRVVQAFTVLSTLGNFASFGIILGTCGVYICMLHPLVKHGGLWTCHRLSWWAMRILDMSAISLAIAALVFGIEAKVRNYANPEGPLNYGVGFVMAIVALGATLFSCILYEVSYHKYEEDMRRDYEPIIPS